MNKINEVIEAMPELKPFGVTEVFIQDGELVITSIYELLDHHVTKIESVLGL